MNRGGTAQLLRCSAALACTLSLAVLAGCEFEGGKNSMQIEMNTCSSSNPCESDSKCQEGRCVADAAKKPLTIALEVTPLQMSDGAPQPLPIILDSFVVLKSADHDFPLPKAAEVKGLVRNLDARIEANLSFVPTKTIPGVAAHAVTASVTSSATPTNPDYSVRLLDGVEYRMLVKPMDMTLPPYSEKFVAGDVGRRDVQFATLPGLREETLSITGDAADRDLLVTAVDARGEPISSTASVTKGKAVLVFAAGTEDAPFRIEIRAAQSFDQAPTTAAEGSLCDADTPAFPVFSIDGSALTRDDKDRWTIVLPKQPERIRYEGTVELCPEEQANTANVTNLPITLHSRSLLLDHDTSLTASFDATTSANYDKTSRALRFCVQVMPGEYDVLATPPASMACALFAESRLIKPPDSAEDKAVTGALLSLPKAAYLSGTVQANGATPLADASIEATALGRSAAVELPPGDRSITRYNRSSDTSTAADGRFKLPVDLGSYDVVVKPLVESGFPWQVRPDVKVGLGARNFPFGFGTTIDMRSPVVVTGSLRYKNASEEAQASLKGAEVEAYALIDDADRGQRALPVGKAIADEDGTFMLLLPLSIDGTW